jgi:hypothetical protein
MKKLDERAQADLSSLRDRVLLSLQFMDEAEDLGPLADQIRRTVESTCAKQDLRAMRLIARDVDALTNALPPYQRDGLEALLNRRLGVDKDAERLEASRHVAALLQRGTIQSEKERRRLEEYVEMLETTGGDPAEVDAVRRLLSGR